MPLTMLQKDEMLHDDEEPKEIKIFTSEDILELVAQVPHLKVSTGH